MGESDKAKWEVDKIMSGIVREYTEENYLTENKNHLINLSNHPSSAWSGEQLAAAYEFGDVIDMPFPQVRADADEEMIRRMAEDAVERILGNNPSAVLVQGEFTLTYRIVATLLEKGVKVLAACSERRTKEWTEPDGTTVKTVNFSFVRFREYR